MKHHGCLIVLLAALAAPMIEAQAPNPSPPPHYSIREAPETLVYQIFFREYVGSQRAADQRRDKGENDTGLRNLYQRRFGLDTFEHQALNSAAQTCVATQEANVRRAQELVQELKLDPDNAALKSQIGQLRSASKAAVAEGVHQLRASLVLQRFQRLDLMIRLHVVPNLRTGVRPATGSPGGN